jgi:hypothetical protein
MNLIYAHEKTENTDLPSIFLGGPSPRGNGEFDWRPEAIEILKQQNFNGDVFIPLPRDGVYLVEYDKQVNWELEHFNKATVIIFWIPRDLKNLPGFTTNVEFGMFLKSGKIVLGYPENAPKMKYLDMVARMNNVPVSNDLKETIKLAFDMLKK